jgi:hypothetical protein
MQNHVATRIPGFNYDSAYRGIDIVSASTADYANWKLWDTLSIGGWFYMAGHGIDGDGYEPVTSQYLRDHLTYASSLSSTLWIDTFLNVARYRLCRDQITPEVTITSSRQASIRMGGAYSASLCMAPLTVSIPILEALQEVHAQTAQGTVVPVMQSAGMLLVNVKPGEDVFLQIP